MEKAIKERIEKWKKENTTDGKEVSSDSVYDNLNELILDGKKFSTIKSEDNVLLIKFKNLERLCLNQTGIQTLENLPKIDSLNVLELTDNHLSTVDTLKYIVNYFPNIKTLEIGGNHFKNLKDFEVLKNLKNLTRLGVQFNPFAEDSNYRKELFEFLPNVKIIDCYNKEGAEVPSSDEEEEEEEEEEEYEEDNTLKNFYEVDYKEDEEEDEEFVPNDNEEEDDDELDDDLEDEEIDDADKDDDNEDTKESEDAKIKEKSQKRKKDSLDDANQTDIKKTKVE